MTIRDNPKSHILTAQCLSTRQLALFRSKWTIFIRCTHIIPLHTDHPCKVRINWKKIFRNLPKIWGKLGVHTIYHKRLSTGGGSTPADITEHFQAASPAKFLPLPTCMNEAVERAHVHVLRNHGQMWWLNASSQEQNHCCKPSWIHPHESCLKHTVLMFQMVKFSVLNAHFLNKQMPIWANETLQFKCPQQKT